MITFGAWWGYQTETDSFGFLKDQCNWGEDDEMIENEEFEDFDALELKVIHRAKYECFLNFWKNLGSASLW